MPRSHPEPDQFAQKLHAMLLAYHIPRHQFASTIGVEVSTLRKYACGQRTPSLEMKQKIIIELRTYVTELQKVDEAVQSLRPDFVPQAS